MKFDFNNRITRDDFPKAGEAFKERFITNHSQMVRELSQGLNGQLTFSENLKAQVISVTMTHGVTTNITNPFSAMPTNCFVLGCSNSYSVRGQPALSNLGNGLIGVVVNFDDTNSLITQETAKINTVVSSVTTMITDWVSYTPTGSWTTNTSYSGKWRRVGDSVECQVNISLTGAPNATGLTQVAVPSGLTIDTSKIPNFAANRGSFGWGNMASGGNASYMLNIVYQTTTAVRPLTYLTGSSVDSAITNTAPGTFANGDRLDFWFRMPIVGWTSQFAGVTNPPATTTSALVTLLLLDGS